MKKHEAHSIHPDIPDNAVGNPSHHFWKKELQELKLLKQEYEKTRIFPKIRKPSDR